MSKSVQQRLVHRQAFALPEAEVTVEELSVDGGNIRIRTPEGEACSWKGYKAACLHEPAGVAASFGNNTVVIWDLEHCCSVCSKHSAAGGIGLVSPDGKLA